MRSCAVYDQGIFEMHLMQNAASTPRRDITLYIAYDHELTLSNKTKTMVDITEAAATSSLDIRQSQVILTGYFAEFTSAKCLPALDLLPLVSALEVPCLSACSLQAAYLTTVWSCTVSIFNSSSFCSPLISMTSLSSLT